MLNLGTYTAVGIVAGACWLHAGLGASAEEPVAAGLAFPLRAHGRSVIDASGKRVKLACANWAGGHTMTKVPGGLLYRRPEEIAASISSMGFNCVRLPYSTEAYIRNPVVRQEYISQLRNSTNQTFLDVFDEVVAMFSSQKLMVIMSNHNNGWGWCCGMFDGSGVWFNKELPESAWLDALRGLARRYRNNPWVVGHDIRNEPRPAIFYPWLRVYIPIWGNTDDHWPMFVDWRRAAEIGSAAVLEEDPNALVIIQLLQFSAFLCAYQLEQNPLRVPQDRVVWSPHDFHWFSDGHIFWWPACEAAGHSGPRLVLDAVVFAVIGKELEKMIALPAILVVAATSACLAAHASTGRRLRRRSLLMASSVLFLLMFSLAVGIKTVNPVRAIDTYESFARSRDAAYGHLLLNGTGPVWIGEFGEAWPSEYWVWLMKYMKDRDVDFAYWLLDGERYPEAAEHFGDLANTAGVGGRKEYYSLLMSDYKTVHHEWKVHDLQYLMGQQPNLSEYTLRRKAEVAPNLEL